MKYTIFNTYFYKTNRKILLLLMFLFVFFVNGISQNATIQGRIFNTQNNEPIPFANIIIYGTNIGSISDLDGNFLFKGITPGIVRLAATSVGFEMKITEEFMVSNAKPVFIEMPMIEKIANLEVVEITSSTFTRTEESPVSLRTIGVQEIEKSPGANRDISKVIQSFPGVASGPAFRNDVIVRGGGASENRFYLDGIEIPNLNHFATQGASGGPVGIVNVDFLREVDFYTGAFPANRGNALSSILDMKMKEGNKDKLTFRGAVGASDLALTADGPMGDNSTFIFSARRSYLQFLFGAIGLPFLPTYNDFQYKQKIRFNQKNELTIIGLGAIDQFELNLNANETEEQRYILNYLPVNEQWNYTIGAVYRNFQKNGYHTLAVSRNMLRNITYKYQNNIESDANKLLDYQSDEIENKIRYEKTLRLNDWKIVYGTGGEYAKYLNSTFQKIYLPQPVGLTNLQYNSFLEVYKYNVFGQVSKSFMEKRLMLSLGLRTDINNYDANMSNPINQLSPRFSSSYALTEKWYWNFNAGRYYQLPPYTTLGYRDNNNVSVNKQNNITYIQVDHLVSGLEYQPGKNRRFTLEGFYKWYDNYPFSLTDSIAIASKGADFGTFGDEAVKSISQGKAYGFEFLAQEKMYKGFNIIVSYTFVRSEFADKNGKFIPSAWDNRHLMNATISKSFKKNWDVGMRWRYVGGAPYTPYDLEKSAIKAAWDIRGRAYLDYSRFNNERLSAFHQLDVRVDKQYYYKKFSLMLYLDIQNFYNFKSQQPDFITLQTDENGIAITNTDEPNKYVLKTLKNESGTVLPTIGVIVEF